MSVREEEEEGEGEQEREGVQWEEGGGVGATGLERENINHSMGHNNTRK